VGHAVVREGNKLISFSLGRNKVVEIGVVLGEETLEIDNQNRGEGAASKLVPHDTTAKENF
jgi:hypothetical protein